MPPHTTYQAGRSARRDPMKELRGHLFEKGVKSAFEPDKRFVPNGAVAEAFTRDAVMKCLELNPEQANDTKLLDYIMGNALVIFATCVEARFDQGFVISAMWTFLDHDFRDDSVEFPINAEATDKHDIRLGAFPDGLWEPVDIGSFYDAQAKLVAPVFTPKLFEYRLRDNQALPFTWRGETMDQGNFGSVTQIVIHERHFKGTKAGSKATMAIKQLYTGSIDHKNLAAAVYRVEAMALQKIRNKIKHTNLIRCHAAITRHTQGFFLFPWANGNNLRVYMNVVGTPVLTPDFVRQLLTQLKGLSSALNDLHHYCEDEDLQVSNEGEAVETMVEDILRSGGIRHGDLKPENILRFLDSDEGLNPNTSDPNGILGTWKIADLGLAIHHHSATTLRQNGTNTRHGTARYEPPEADLEKPLSRLYDTWSLGCIFLEVLVWLLYGFRSLEDFNSSIKNSQSGHSDPPYHETLRPGEVKLHRNVQQCLDFLSRDQECSETTALGALLNIVQTMLLVVELPAEHQGSFPIEVGPGPTDEDSGDRQTPSRINVSQPSPRSPGSEPRKYRAEAEHVVKELDNILREGQGDCRYFYSGKSRRNLPRFPFSPTATTTKDGHLSAPILLRHAKPGPLPLRPHGAAGAERGGLTAAGMQEPVNLDYAHPILDAKKWDHHVDNVFSRTLLAHFDMKIQRSLFPTPQTDGKLCESCMDLPFWTPQFHIIDNLKSLKEKLLDCHFCQMRWDACKHLSGTGALHVRFDRRESVLRMNESDPPVFSICKSLDFDLPAGTQVQIGFPNVPDVHSRIHLTTLRSWIDDCEKYHDCAGSSLPTPARLPTRLIDVGDTGASSVRLYVTKATDCLTYLALSHPWGDPARHTHFCTTPDNIESHKNGIRDVDIPAATFRDAITATRELGFRYIWIDSLCIIQGPQGDFQNEAKHMEDVFSSASCVLAASRARGQDDGFLKRRRERKFVTYIGRDGHPFYVCQYIDDFNRDVLQGSLNQRGWVLQERALARRTIYFTDRQTYWECGAGVRCETMTKMSNQLASFIGDPKFPSVAIQQTRGGKIRLYQDLYMQYSRLSFTNWEDRAVAILALERRLIRGFRPQGVIGGAFGVLDDGRGLLHRSLLWHRGTDETRLERIIFPVNRDKAPSWSWMAYRGGIKYLDVPFDGVDWELSNIRSPWAGDSSPYVQTIDQSAPLHMDATILPLRLGSAVGGEVQLILDMPNGSARTEPWCVVLARERGSRPHEDRTHYVLLVIPSRMGDARGGKAYERVGVALLLGRCIDFGAGEKVRLK